MCIHTHTHTHTQTHANMLVILFCKQQLFLVVAWDHNSHSNAKRLSVNGVLFYQVSSALELDSFTNGWPLTTVCLWIFRKHNVFATMGIDYPKMAQFLHQVEEGYQRDNPYHNRAHAADVTLKMYSLLCHGINSMSIASRMDSCQLLVTCILAAAVHDYMHPGSNNQ